MRCAASCVLIAACAYVPRAHAHRQADGDTDHKAGTTAHHAVQKKSSAGHASTSHTGARHSSHRKKTSRTRGQQKIDSERARTIQEALIREHYLTGEATGTWNQASEDAMRKYQGDHGWQTKEVPDSRALIKLGLGPSKDHLLNPESAMTTVPDAPRSQSASPTSQPVSTSAPAPAPQTPATQTPPQSQPGDSSSPQ